MTSQGQAQPHPQQILIDLINKIALKDCTLTDEQCLKPDEDDCDECPVPMWLRAQKAYLISHTSTTAPAGYEEEFCKSCNPFYFQGICRHTTGQKQIDNIITCPVGKWSRHPYTSAPAAGHCDHEMKICRLYQADPMRTTEPCSRTDCYADTRSRPYTPPGESKIHLCCDLCGSIAPHFDGKQWLCTKCLQQQAASEAREQLMDIVFAAIDDIEEYASHISEGTMNKQQVLNNLGYLMHELKESIRQHKGGTPEPEPKTYHKEWGDTEP